MARSRPAIDGLLIRLWYSRHPATRLLWPVSALFCLLTGIRRVLYRSGLLASRRIGCPVVIVGNLSVGGTGKTPIVIWLARALKSRGIGVGVICGGYGGSEAAARPVLVRADSRPEAVGDEALLLLRETGVPVAAGRDRWAAAALLEKAAACDLILSDDGLQHLRLARAFEIAVIDGARGLGNGLCLPVGPLREPARRLKSVDAVVVNEPCNGVSEFDAHLAAATCRVSPVSARELASSRTLPIDAFRGQRVHAVAAIGNPDRFFDSLRTAGIDVIAHPHRDHAMLQPADFDFTDDRPVLTTAKDAVKYRGKPPPGIWEVAVELEFPDRAGEKLVERVERLLEGTNAIQ